MKPSLYVRRLYADPLTRGVLIGFTSGVVLVLTFGAGVAVGYHKAVYSHGMSENYMKTFGMVPSPLNSMMRMREPGLGFTPSHGTSGSVIRFEYPLLVIEGIDGVEKMVHVSSSTMIRRFRDAASTSDLTIGGAVVVIGSPNEASEIEAHLIRLMPSFVPMMMPPVNEPN